MFDFVPLDGSIHIKMYEFEELEKVMGKKQLVKS